MKVYVYNRVGKEEPSTQGQYWASSTYPTTPETIKEINRSEFPGGIVALFLSGMLICGSCWVIGWILTGMH